MSDDIAIKVECLSKCYHIYDQPRDRLKQMILPRLQRAAGAATKQYFREFWALRDVSFEVRKGETVGIIGRNGSGKSTLLQMICGTLNPTSGSIQTNGRIAALLELGSGFNPEFTGRENVYMNAAVLGLSDDEIDARFDEIVSFADIGDFIDQPVKVYSSGMVVRLAFAVAINSEPEILVVDEALSVGDELFQRKCFSKIESIRKLGSTILFVSHSAAQVVELCDRALLIDSGEKIIEGEPKRVVAIYQKIIHAPKGERQKIKQKLLFANFQGTIFTKNKQSNIGGYKIIEEEDYFDPGLVPVSTISYEARGVEIQEVKIFTIDGRRVNVLRRGKRYVYEFSARFLKTLHSVRFGMGIRTTSGLFLAGSYSVPNIAESIPIVESGRIVQVSYEFDCTLNPGIYFTNAAVFGLIDGEETVLHRIVDVAAIRVMHVSSDIATGYQWISPAVKVTLQ